jgi:hypothetical protein
MISGRAIRDGTGGEIADVADYRALVRVSAIAILVAVYGPPSLHA